MVPAFGIMTAELSTTNQLYTFNNRYVLGAIARYSNTAKIFSRKNLFGVGIDYNYVYGDITSFTNVAGNKGDDLQLQNLEILGNVGVYLQNQYYIFPEYVPRTFRILQLHLSGCLPPCA